MSAATPLWLTLLSGPSGAAVHTPTVRSCPTKYIDPEGVTRLKGIRTGPTSQSIDSACELFIDYDFGTLFVVNDTYPMKGEYWDEATRAVINIVFKYLRTSAEVSKCFQAAMAQGELDSKESASDPTHGGMYQWALKQAKKMPALQTICIAQTMTIRGWASHIVGPDFERPSETVSLVLSDGIKRDPFYPPRPPIIMRCIRTGLTTFRSSSSDQMVLSTSSFYQGEVPVSADGIIAYMVGQAGSLPRKGEKRKM